MDQALTRHVMNQAALVQIGVGEIVAVTRSVKRALDADEHGQAEQLGDVVLGLCERLAKLAENIETDVCAAALSAGGQ